LRGLRKQLAGLGRSVARAERELKAKSAFALLEELEVLEKNGVRSPLDVGYWRRYWLDKEAEEVRILEERLRESVDRVAARMREQGGEEWDLRLAGEYPRYTISPLKAYDVQQLLEKRGSVEAALDYVARDIEAIMRPRYESAWQFLRALYAAYRVALVLGEKEVGADDAVGVEQLHRCLDFVMRQERRLRRGEQYPGEAMGVDLARCVREGAMEVGGMALELIEAKTGGLLVVCPGIAERRCGKVRFYRGKKR
jgi:hypothetical protein